MRFPRSFLLLNGGLALAFIASGCRADGATIESQLGQSYGGMTMDDEAPMFDESVEYESIGEAEEDAEPVIGDDSVDATASDDADLAVDDVENDAADAAAVYAVRIHWGRMPFDADASTSTTWDPTVHTDCGFLAVRRLVAFEDATDDGVVRPRSDAQTVSFTSITQPSVDGVILALVIPPAQAACAATGSLTIESAALAAPIVLPLDATLADTELSVDAALSTDGSERMVVAAQRLERNGACVRGYLTGRWQAFSDEDGVHPGLGYLRGRVLGPLGGLRGHVRGIYGEPNRGRFAGEQIFFGKIIETDGRFMGLLAGRYGDGIFGGGWLLRPALAGLHGRLHGRYTPATDGSGEGDSDGGYFVARYASAACARPVDAETLEE